METLEGLMKQIDALSDAEKEMLLFALAGNLALEIPHETAWVEEAKRRFDLAKSGAIPFRSEDEVHRSIEKLL